MASDKWTIKIVTTATSEVSAKSLVVTITYKLIFYKTNMDTNTEFTDSVATNHNGNT